MSYRFRDQRDDEQETHELPQLENEVRIQRFVVRVETGPAEGHAVVSNGAELSIGSSQGNDLVLDDATVSRHHAVIESGERGFWLKDLDSTNGTVLAGHRIKSAMLKSGSVFVVGRTQLRFESLDEQICEALSSQPQFASALGQSAAMRRIFALLPRIAASDSTVLLEGETGTGKTLLASAIHEASVRAAGPFVVVDCAALTPTLIESHLFGHARGAFTGALSAHVGAFEMARGGTVFLDEVGELPPELQPKLLRVLEERTVTPLGTTRPVPIDARVLAATNRDLREEVNRGGFRADLFFRLAVVRVRVPALRERPEDIELYARHFWTQLARSMGAASSPGAGVPPDELLEAWKRLHWSGNVRELRAAVERALLLGTSSLDRSAPSSDVDLSVPYRVAKENVVTSFERAYLSRLVERSGGNLSQAARSACMDRNHLRELLRRHGLDRRNKE
jgi:two-component system, NtrC family, response regulator GlrR